MPPCVPVYHPYHSPYRRTLTMGKSLEAQLNNIAIACKDSEEVCGEGAHAVKQCHHVGLPLEDNTFVIADARNPTNGNASHHYMVMHMAEVEWADDGEEDLMAMPLAEVHFQDGPRADPESKPGIMDTVLLTIAIDRYAGFVSGKFNSPLNEEILQDLKDVCDKMQTRTRERLARGVLGKNVL
jgi:hypothetical protein